MSTTILTASVTAAARLAGDREWQQNHLALTCAAELLREELKEVSASVSTTKVTVTITDRIMDTAESYTLYYPHFPEYVFSTSQPPGKYRMTAGEHLKSTPERRTGGSGRAADFYQREGAYDLRQQGRGSIPL